MVLALNLNVGGQPLNVLWHLDLVTIAPVPPSVLHIIVEDKFIHGSVMSKWPFHGM